MSAQAFIQSDPQGVHHLNLMVEGMHCPSCVSIIESALKKQPGVAQARLNLSTKRLNISWEGTKDLGDKWISLIQSMGYRAAAFDPETSESQEKREEKFLLRCLAVAGFASGNLMLFSIPLWTTDNVEMGEATRTMFQWIQAIIAIPALAYCGQPFYRSAWRALKEWRTNMDVPISVAVILATAMSVFETIHHGQHAYFDSAVMLLFFLLIGRYLESRARGRARSAAHDLLRMRTGTATALLRDGSQQTLPISEIREGMTLLVATGEKIGADGDIITGESELDTSLITGETIPQRVRPGTHVFAGTINLASSITLRVTGAGERSLLADIVRLMETAEQSQARYVTLADKISGWYTPAVHALAAATFAGWLYHGAPWQVALLYAATVLVITCPCALGLAVPVVQVLASGKLMRRGILLKSGSALERLAEITHVAFDKTGTLTVGRPQLLPGTFSEQHLQLAASLAAHSRHPLSQALVQAYKGPLLTLEVCEIPGFGLEAGGIRLGRSGWCGPDDNTDSLPSLWLAVKGEPPVRFTFQDQLRQDARSLVASLQREGLPVSLLSGDRPEVVAQVAQECGIHDYTAALSPVDKCTRLNTLKNSGARVLMIGDGLNDAPSLASAYASMSPSSAMDITQNAADIVFQGESLAPVRLALDTSHFAQKLVKQNFFLAIAYNAVAIPLAVAGYVTPLVAAIAMSSSSLIVIANAMRLNMGKEQNL